MPADSSGDTETKSTRVLTSIDWNGRPISYEIPLNTPVSNSPETRVAPTMSKDNKVRVILLEADIDDLESKIREHGAAIRRLRAEIRSKEGQIKRRRINY
ncbi:hypothetical protein MFLAVUS_002633 [Mucor flavus]|uniref:Uncharacterized protein n=1 Tax=Mucor flavus TaxID=439312 RepID=A0ABP9YQT3_9FUNG